MTGEQKVQYKVIRFLLATINYGGRITDDKDERFIKSFVTTFITPELVKNRDKFSFDSKGMYKVPPDGPISV